MEKSLELSTYDKLLKWWLDFGMQSNAKNVEYILKLI